MSFSTAITASIGADVGPLRAAGPQVAAAAGALAGEITKKLEMRDVGRTFATALGLNLATIADKLVAPFRESAEAAGRIADHSDRAANATERLIALRQTDLQQLQTLEKQFARIAEESKKPAELSTWEKVKTAIIAGPVFALSELKKKRDELNAEKGARSAAELAEKGLEIEIKKRAIEKQGDMEALKAIKDQLAADETRAEALTRLATFEREQRLAKLTDEKRAAELVKERAVVAKEIAAYENFTREGGKLTTEGVNALLGLKTQQRDLEKSIADLTKSKGEAERKVTIELLKQLEAQQQMDQLNGKRQLVAESTLIINGKAYGQARDPSLFQGASSSALAELITRLRTEIGTVEGAKGTGPTALADAATGFLIHSSVIARLRTDLIRAEYELNQRNAVARNTAQYGEEGARRRYEGDPLQFDDVMRRSQQAADEQTELLRKIEEGQRRGFGAISEGLKSV